MNYDSYLENEEVCVDDIAKLLEVSRKSAIQRMSRLVKKNQAIKLNMPTVGNPARFKLLVSKESLLHTQKFGGGPKMNREIDWKKFCSDPFGMTKKEVTE
jgi:DNA-binding transcriptional regulator GbsR (MarR family)